MKRRHHFVPQFYLRAFASAERCIHIIRLKEATVIQDASLRDQCYRRRFYGRGDELENAFAKLEERAAPLISSIVRTCRSPENGSVSHELLVRFIALQHLRTTTAMVRTQSAANSMAEAAFDGAPPAGFVPSQVQSLALSLGVLPHMGVALGDLKAHVIIAPPDQEFVTSDNPVCRYNEYCRGISGIGVLGATCRGLQVLLPLSPRVSVLLFDSGVYKVGYRGAAPSSVATPHDVMLLNLLVFLAARENVYFATWSRKDELMRLANGLESGTASRMRITKAVEVGNERSTLLHQYEEQPTLELRLSFVGLRRAARRVPLFDRVRRYRKHLPLPVLPEPPGLADGRTHVFKVQERK